MAALANVPIRFGLLVAGVTMPIATVHTFLLLPKPKSILDETLMLYDSVDLLIAGIVGAFSLLFPTLLKAHRHAHADSASSGAGQWRI